MILYVISFLQYSVGYFIAIWPVNIINMLIYKDVGEAHERFLAAWFDCI